MLQDAHIHLQDAAGQAGRILAEAAAAGVGRFFCNGAAPSDWEAVRALAASHAGVVPFFGVHPWYVEEAHDGWDAELVRYLGAPGARIGEIGLDKAKRAVPFRRQAEAFRRQLEIAREMGNPFTVHCVQAWGELLSELERQGAPRVPFIVHCYSGSPEVARRLSALGGYISFSTRLFDGDSGKHRESFAATPVDRILLETDYPYMPGVARGTIPPPEEYFETLRLLYARAAELKAIDRAGFEEKVWDNGTVFAR